MGHRFGVPMLLAFCVFKHDKMKAHYSVIKKTMKGKAVLLTLLLCLALSGLQAQERERFNIGLRGGFGMATLNGYENNGLRLGMAFAVCGIYNITENTSVIADLGYAMGGQQSERWITEGRDEMKEYSRFGFHYLNIPVLYQYYFTDILGLEGGINFKYCLSGRKKTKIGNGSWESDTNFGRDDYNNFDMGVIFGVFTKNIIPNENFLVSLRAYLGFLDVVKDIGRNKNFSVQISFGYTLF